MNIEQIQSEIKKINNNTNLNNEEKKLRIKVYQTLIELNIQESKYNEQMIKFIQDANEMVTVSDGSFQLNDSLEHNKIALKGNILESDLVKELNSKGIKDFTPEDLRTIHIPFYEQEHNIKLIETSLAIKLYEQIENIEKINQNKIETLHKNLKYILGKDIITKTIKKNNIEEAMNKIDELHTKNILDLKTKNIILQILNQLLNYYQNNNLIVPINIIEQSN